MNSPLPLLPPVPPLPSAALPEPPMRRITPSRRRKRRGQYRSFELWWAMLKIVGL